MADLLGQGETTLCHGALRVCRFPSNKSLIIFSSLDEGGLICETTGIVWDFVETLQTLWTPMAHGLPTSMLRQASATFTVYLISRKHKQTFSNFALWSTKSTTCPAHTRGATNKHGHKHETKVGKTAQHSIKLVTDVKQFFSILLTFVCQSWIKVDRWEQEMNAWVNTTTGEPEWWNDNKVWWYKA